MRRRKNGKWEIIFIFLFACLLCSGSFVFSGKGPKMKFKKASWDFGKVKQGKMISHVFVFKNEGDEILKIKGIRTSCGCTAALTSEKEIIPGKNGEIKVTFNTIGDVGKVTKKIYVDSNDPKQPSMLLTVSANIEVPPQPRISLNRYTLDLGLFLDEEEIRGRTKIKNTGELELKVNCSHNDASFFLKGKKISFPLKIASGKEAEVEIRIPPRKKTGVMREYILVKSNDPRRQALSLHLSGYIVTKKQLKELFTRHKKIID